MKLFLPYIYQKDIYSINYDSLKEKGIKCLIFDLDNTLGLITETNCPLETKELVTKLKKDFLVYIISNNTRKRIKPYLDDLDINGIAWSIKPSIKALIKIRKTNNLSKSEMCIIGDQMVTDILAGNRYKILTVLVEPLGKKDLKITSLNRLLEQRIIKNYQRKGLFERGRYYE